MWLQTNLQQRPSGIPATSLGFHRSADQTRCSRSIGHHSMYSTCVCAGGGAHDRLEEVGDGEVADHARHEIVAHPAENPRKNVDHLLSSCDAEHSAAPRHCLDGSEWEGLVRPPSRFTRPHMHACILCDQSLCPRVQAARRAAPRHQEAAQAHGHRLGHPHPRHSRNHQLCQSLRQSHQEHAANAVVRSMHMLLSTCRHGRHVYGDVVATGGRACTSTISHRAPACGHG